MYNPFKKQKAPVQTTVTPDKPTTDVMELLDKPWLDPNPETKRIWDTFKEQYAQSVMSRPNTSGPMIVYDELLFIAGMISAAGIAPRSDVVLIFQTVQPHLPVTDEDIGRLYEHFRLNRLYRLRFGPTDFGSSVKTWATMPPQVNVSKPPYGGYTGNPSHQSFMGTSEPENIGRPVDETFPWHPKHSKVQQWLQSGNMTEPFSPEVMHGMHVRLACLEQRLHALENAGPASTTMKSND